MEPIADHNPPAVRLLKTQVKRFTNPNLEGNPMPPRKPPQNVSDWRTQPRNRGPKYGSRVLVGGYFHPDVKKQLRAIAIANDTTVQQLLIEALNRTFFKYGQPCIAGHMPKPEAP
jgi:hypothetical protein